MQKYDFTFTDEDEKERGRARERQDGKQECGENKNDRMRA